MCCCTPSTFSWAIYKSTLAPTSYLSRAWKLTRHECLGHFQVFSEHLPHPGHACVLFDFQEYVGTFQRLYSPKYLTVQFSFPGFLVCLLFAQIAISFPRWQQLINFLLNVSDKCPLGTHLSASDKFWVRWNKEEPFAPVLQGATRQLKTHWHNSLRTRSILHSLALGTCTRNAGTLQICSWTDDEEMRPWSLNDTELSFEIQQPFWLSVCLVIVMSDYFPEFT